MFKKYWKFFVIFWSVVLVGIIGVFVFFWLISAGKLGFMPTFEELENPNNRFASEVYFADGPIMNRYFEKENRKYRIPGNSTICDRCVDRYRRCPFLRS